MQLERILSVLVLYLHEVIQQNTKIYKTVCHDWVSAIYTVHDDYLISETVIYDNDAKTKLL